jgi:hypothetical protein
LEPSLVVQSAALQFWLLSLLFLCITAGTQQNPGKQKMMKPTDDYLFLPPQQ